MKIAMFYHSLISCWNNGNAHFLRGIVAELLSRGHEVHVYEPADGWSRTNLLRNYGWQPLVDFQRSFPHLRSSVYSLSRIRIDRILAEVDLVIAHEWNDPRLLRQIVSFRRHCGYRLLFHDTHHRLLTDSKRLTLCRLEEFDGVLAFGEVLRNMYVRRGCVPRAWTWHEAADTRIFKPVHDFKRGELVWIGNWGDGERQVELQEFLLEPARELKLETRVYGVRYPPHARLLFRRHQVKLQGWLANHKVPGVFSRYKCTVHVPRRPYVESLPGIPTIRVFEALASKIPLVSAWWDDREHLFSPGSDFLVAKSRKEMVAHLKEILNNRELADSLAERGYQTIMDRHTCKHRVDQLIEICRELGIPSVQEDSSPEETLSHAARGPGGYHVE